MRLGPVGARMAAGALSAMASWVDERINRSGRACHDRQVVDRARILGLLILRGSAMTTRLAVASGHEHGQSRHSRGTPGLLDGRSRACRIRVDADGSTAPDGMR